MTENWHLTWFRLYPRKRKDYWVKPGYESENAGVDVVHGHSSHHPLGIEVYRDKLIIYGATAPSSL